MKENIALIGFMGSGKTTVGRILSKHLEMKFVDLDKLIASREKKTIPEIFEEKGEEYFRKLEREIADEESRDSNVVISTGGGIIIDNENIKNLKKTSFVVYLNCEIDCIYERIKNSKTRPLILNSEDVYERIRELYEKRKMLYTISADFIVSINRESNLYDTVETIKNAYIRS